MANLLQNGLCEKKYVRERRLDLQIIKKIPQAMIISRQMKEEGHD